MTTGILQNQPVPTDVATRYRPFASTLHQVTKGRYITSNDPRGYIPVYEYPLNNQWIMMDIDDGYILWTGIWKALGNSKADIVKMIDSQPDLAPAIRRVRGGYLKIQGTWMPYDVALKLSRRVAWNIRDDLIPIFGPAFPSTCLSPDQPGYGQVVASSGRKRSRKSSNTRSIKNAMTPATQITQWVTEPASSYHSAGLSVQSHHPSKGDNIHSGYPSPQRNHAEYSPNSTRYSPYPGPVREPSSSSRGGRLCLDINTLSIHSTTPSPIDVHRRASDGDHIVLPPIRDGHLLQSQRASLSGYALPPISALEDLRGVNCHDSAAVLRRLNDDCDLPSMGSNWRPVDYSGRPLSAPPSKARLQMWSQNILPLPASAPAFAELSTRGYYQDSSRPSPHRRLSSAMSDLSSHDGSSTSSYEHSPPSTPLSSLSGHSLAGYHSSPKWQHQYRAPSPAYDPHPYRRFDDHWGMNGIRGIVVDDARMSSCRDDDDSMYSTHTR